MGKKVKIVNEDPILSKNFKYEKRKKEKMMERLKQKEQEEIQKKKMKEIHEVQSKVDKQIAEMTNQLIKLKHGNHINKTKEKIFNSTQPIQQKSINNFSTKCEQIVFSRADQKQYKMSNAYTAHFQKSIDQNLLFKEKKQDLMKKIEEDTKNEIRSMFAVTQKLEIEEQMQEQQKQQQNEEPFNYKKQLKKESQIKIGEFHYQITQNSIENLKQVKVSNNQELNKLNISKQLINNYFDHIYFDNNQEQDIQSFRKIVIQHCFDHLQSCEADQRSKGYTHGKILILTPFVGDARGILQIIQEKLMGYSTQNKEKLDELDDQNDFFRIGIKISKKKKAIHYFSHFDISSIIISSPVGLKAIIGSDGDKERQNSFLSSIEIMYIDRASVMLMQNWDHLTQIMKNMNKMAKYSSLKNSINEIRQSFLKLKGRIYRQSIVFSQFSFPELNSMKLNHFHNFEGAITSKIFYQKQIIPTKAEKNFYKIELKQPKDDLQFRFEYFKRKFWDNLHNKESVHKIIIFVNSYFEYVKLKSFFEKVNASFEAICEHSKKSKIQSRVSRFNNNQFRILLLTQRAYYYQICEIKKFHHLYFYSLPKNAFIFNELCGSIETDEDQENKIVVIYTKFDMLILERIVGTIKAYEMVKQFCSNVSFIV